MMLPLLLFPISIRLCSEWLRCTTAILTGENSAHFWIVLLLTYDVVVYYCLSGMF